MSSPPLSSLQGARVLVTGATGLVGGALVDGLVARGARVRALVRAGRGGSLRGRNDVDVIDVDGYDAAAVRAVLSAAVERVPVDVAFHVGAAGVKPDEQDPLALVDGNVGVTVAVLQALARQATPPSRVLFTSSSAVYGEARGDGRLREGDTLAPASVYGGAKLAAEQLGQLVARRLGLSWIVLRLFGVYGPGEAPHRMIPYLARAVRDGGAPQLTPGEQRRDWIYVDDVVDALCRAATAPLAHDTYNVCSGVAVDVRTVARLVGQCALNVDTNSDANATATADVDGRIGLGAKPYRADEPMFVVGDPALFHADTGWAPTTSMSEGVERAVRWALAASPAPTPASMPASMPAGGMRT